MKTFFYLCLLLPLCRSVVSAQIKWQEDTSGFSGIEWNNYSTSYVGKDFDKSPTLIVALAYNGIYGDPGGSPIDIASPTGLYEFRGNGKLPPLMMPTYDSSDVYFLTPGIFRNNSDRYECRVYLNDSTTIVPWSRVGRFTDHGFQLNEFRPEFGFLGGYRTTWGNYLTAELREKATEKVLSVVRIFWKEMNPRIKAVFTPAELTDFLLKTKRPFDMQVNAGSTPKRSDTLKPGDNQLILFMAADIYKKEALEYRLMRNGRLLMDWRPNDFDNNAVRLENLAPGDYRLELRYRRQRQNVTGYLFYKEPFWYQRGWVWPAVGLLVIVFGFLLARMLNLRRQKRLLGEANKKMSAVASELRYIQAQLNPHFIFNALGSIQGLINKNDVSQANYYLTEFSSLLRETLGGDEKGMVPLKGELKMLQRYLNLEQLRFNFTSEIRVETAINENEVSFPALLLQPLVENAVKHGLPGMQREGMILIVLRNEGGNLEVTVSDNGKGFDPGLVGEGFGLKLTKERILLINETTPGRPVAMRIASRPMSGTQVYLSFKNWLK